MLRLSSFSEPLTETFVESSLSVHARLVSKSPETFQVLLDLDETCGVKNPLDSVHKLLVLAQKAGCHAN